MNVAKDISAVFENFTPLIKYKIKNGKVLVDKKRHYITKQNPTTIDINIT